MCIQQIKQSSFDPLVLKQSPPNSIDRYLVKTDLNNLQASARELNTFNHSNLFSHFHNHLLSGRRACRRVVDTLPTTLRLVSLIRLLKLDAVFLTWNVRLGVSTVVLASRTLSTVLWRRLIPALVVLSRGLAGILLVAVVRLLVRILRLTVSSRSPTGTVEWLITQTTTATSGNTSM